MSTGGNVNDFNVDAKSNVIVPQSVTTGTPSYYSSSIRIYAPRSDKGTCAKLLGTIKDPVVVETSVGQFAAEATSAAANDAANGTIVVGNEQGGAATGVMTCKLSSHSCTPLTSPNMGTAPALNGYVFDVAMDKAGNCYADAGDTTGKIGLWYYAKCKGTGTELSAAQGFNESLGGGISVDNNGYVVAVSPDGFPASSVTSTVTVYSGCSTGKCKVVGGPFKIGGDSYFFGHLSPDGTRFVAVNLTAQLVDVFAYKPKQLRYLYSFGGNDVTGNDCDSCESAVWASR